MTVVRRDVVKAVDGLFATTVAGPIAYRVVCAIVDTAVTPNQVTLVSRLLMLGAAWAASRGTLAANLVAIVLLQVSFVLDMVDGQLARARASGSPLGAFIDEFTDRVGEAVLYAGVACGAAAALPSIWPLAFAALAVVLLRHVGDLVLLVRFGLDAAGERRLQENGWITQRLRAAGVGDEQQGRGFASWLKKALWFSIGDRYALLSLSLLVLRPDLYFWMIVVLAAPSYFGRLAQKAWRLS